MYFLRMTYFALLLKMNQLYFQTQKLTLREKIMQQISLFIKTSQKHLFRYVYYMTF